MKTYKCTALSRFKTDDKGRRQCPTGYYPNLEVITDPCTFGNGSIIGYSIVPRRTGLATSITFTKPVTFGDLCAIHTPVVCLDSVTAGEACTFADSSKFYSKLWTERNCSFGTSTVIGQLSNIGEHSMIGYDCEIRDGATLSHGCTVGDRCRIWSHLAVHDNVKFGKQCSFGPCLTQLGPVKVEGVLELAGIDSIRVFTGFGSTRRDTYAFNTTTGIYIRCGCFLGTLKEWRAKIRNEYPAGVMFSRRARAGRECLQLADFIAGLWR